jgi:RNA polymerase sigma factor (TIGR02999 family)
VAYRGLINVIGNSEMQERNEVTQYLAEANRGNSRAYDRVYELVYDDLKQIAHHRLFGFKRDDTLNTTALVHESYLKLINSSEPDWQDRAHFYAVASRAMRYILIDHIRTKSAQKRGEGAEMKPLEEINLAVEQRVEDFITLNTALEKLLQWNERLGRLVEYRFIGGMTYEEISEVTGLSEATLKRDWVRARAWLYNVMKET